MESTDLIKRIAQGDMTEDEQLALLAQVEASIQLRKQAKVVEQELSAFEQAAEVIAQTINEHKQQVDQALTEMRYYVRQPGPAGKDGKVDYGKVATLSQEFYSKKEAEDAQKVKNILGIYW